MKGVKMFLGGKSPVVDQKMSQFSVKVDKYFALLKIGLFWF